jgi:hypothetical protein
MTLYQLWHVVVQVVKDAIIDDGVVIVHGVIEFQISSLGHNVLDIGTGFVEKASLWVVWEFGDGIVPMFVGIEVMVKNFWVPFFVAGEGNMWESVKLNVRVRPDFEVC